MKILNIKNILQADMNGNFNKVAVKLSENYWIEVYSKQEFSTHPFTIFTEGGLSLPGRELLGRFNISETPGVNESYSGDILCKWSEHDELHSKFKVSKSGEFTGYIFSSTTEFAGGEAVELTGTLKLEAQRKSAYIDLSFEGHEKGSKQPYIGRIILRSNDTDKIVYINLQSTKSIRLDIQMQKELKHFKVDLQWGEPQATQRQIFFEFNGQKDFSIELNILQFKSKLVLSGERKSIKLLLSIEEKVIDFETRFKISFDELDLLFSFESSFLSLSKLRAQLSFSQQHLEENNKLEFLVKSNSFL